MAENKIKLQKLESNSVSTLDKYSLKYSHDRSYLYYIQKLAILSSKAGSLKFKDTSYIELALRVLGLMCDNHNRQMQNYLRVQPDNITTINLVSEICIFLQSFYVDATKDNISLINQVIQTLIEMSLVSS